MKKPPPYLVRRLVVAPLLVVASLAALGSLPLWLLIAAFASRFVPGRWRILRVAWFMFLYLMLEALMIVVLFGTWIITGFGWKMRAPWAQDLHYAVAAWWLRRVMGSARRTFRLQIDAEGPIDTLDDDRPLLIFSRHAGPGDSFLLVDAVLNRLDRRPRIVLKDLLQVDPVVDIVLNRLPNRFVPSSGRAGDAVVESLRELAASMSAGDGIVLFPEGGNYTPKRHARAVEKLEDIGRPGLAERARQLDHLLPPKPTGALAAIESAPEADVLFVGHTGLEQLSTMKDLWRGIPMDSNVLAKAWLVRAEDVPAPDEREIWLYDQWSTIDTWISDQRVDTNDRVEPAG